MFYISFNICIVTPLDVIKTRLQVQQKTMLSEKCFVYCNGLMDHLCPCYPASTTNGGATSAGSVVIPPNKPVYNGTIVIYIYTYRFVN